MIRVSILGPEGMLRTGLETLLRTNADFEIGAVTDTNEDLILKSTDVVVALETSFDAVTGSPAVVLIWPAVDVTQVRAAWASGVRAVLPQDATAAELTAAVYAAAAGLITLRAQDLDAFSAEARTSSEAVNLSPREIEVLRLVADGLANKEISHRLGISEHTVKFHINSILNRLNAASRAEAVAIGIRNGFILL